MSLPLHHSPNSSFERVMAGLPYTELYAFSQPHQQVPAETLAVSCGLTPLYTGLPVAFSASSSLTSPLVASQHHRKKKADR